MLHPPTGYDCMTNDQKIKFFESQIDQLRERCRELEYKNNPDQILIVPEPGLGNPYRGGTTRIIKNGKPMVVNWDECEQLK